MGDERSSSLDIITRKFNDLNALYKESQGFQVKAGAITQERDDLKKRLADTQVEFDKKAQELQAANQQVEEAKAAEGEATKSMAEMKNRVTELEKELETCNTSLDDAKEVQATEAKDEAGAKKRRKTR